jgi:hypothetical protein
MSDIGERDLELCASIVSRVVRNELAAAAFLYESAFRVGEVVVVVCKQQTGAAFFL